MKTTDKERGKVMHRLAQLGVGYYQSEQLRRIALTLHSWFERECGTDNGCIERDETTGKTYWLNAMTGNRFPIPDRETGAKKRLAKVMAELPELTAYIQGDCRGASLYILRKADVNGHSIDQVYTQGVAVY